MAIIGRRVAPGMGFGMFRPITAPDFDLTNLVAYWKLSDTADASGNANTLTNNGATFGTGKLGNCAVMTGGDTLIAADSASLSMDTAQAFHIDGWILQASGGSGTNRIVFYKGDGLSVGDNEYALRFNTSNQLVSDTSNGTTDKDFVGSALGALNSDTWYYFAYWHDPVADIVGMQLNATAVTSAWAGGCWNSTKSFKFGGAAGTMAGSLDDVAIYKDIRDAAFRTARYNAGNGRQLF